ncbi:unnamed protein product [Amoebophrya sp. A25]|nr:unnamed protein product [Amoebophrya sp. A25]|eukprot:GSA25T00017160001.1
MAGCLVGDGGAGAASEIFKQERLHADARRDGKVEAPTPDQDNEKLKVLLDSIAAILLRQRDSSSTTTEGRDGQETPGSIRTSKCIERNTVEHEEDFAAEGHQAKGSRGDEDDKSQTSEGMLKLILKVVPRLLGEARRLGSTDCWVTLPHTAEVTSILNSDAKAVPKRAQLWPGKEREGRRRQNPVYQMHCPCCYRPVELRLNLDEDFWWLPPNNTKNDDDVRGKNYIKNVDDERMVDTKNKMIDDESSGSGRTPSLKRTRGERSPSKTIFVDGSSSSSSEKMAGGRPDSTAETDVDTTVVPTSGQEPVTARPKTGILKVSEQIWVPLTEDLALQYWQKNDPAGYAMWGGERPDLDEDEAAEVGVEDHVAGENTLSSSVSTFGSVPALVPRSWKPRDVVGEEDESWNLQYTSDVTREEWTGSSGRAAQAEAELQASLRAEEERNATASNGVVATDEIVSKSSSEEAGHAGAAGVATVASCGAHVATKSSSTGEAPRSSSCEQAQPATTDKEEKYYHGWSHSDWAEWRSQRRSVELGISIEEARLLVAERPSWTERQWRSYVAEQKAKVSRTADVDENEASRSTTADVTLEETDLGKKENNAFVIFLWGKSIEYVLGACVLGKSLRNSKTKHDLLCLHTKEVPELRSLRRYWRTQRIEHVAASDKALYGGWQEQSRFAHVFTKLHALRLYDYEKVLVLDIDMIVKHNIDHLFNLQTPAAMRRGANNNSRYRHGDPLDGRAFFCPENPDEKLDDVNSLSWYQGTGINAGVMLFRPDKWRYEDVCTVVKSWRHPEHICTTAPEQDFLSRYFADAPWYNISVRYNFQLHQVFHNLNPLNDAARKRYLSPTTREKICVIHYSGALKPWHHVCDRAHHDKSSDDFAQTCLDGFDTYKLWHLGEGWQDEAVQKQQGVRRDEESGQLFDLDTGEKVNMELLNAACLEAISLIEDAHQYWLSVWRQMYTEDFSPLERKVFRVLHREKVPWAPWEEEHRRLQIEEANRKGESKLDFISQAEKIKYVET